MQDRHLLTGRAGGEDDIGAAICIAHLVAFERRIRVLKNWGAFGRFEVGVADGEGGLGQINDMLHLRRRQLGGCDDRDAAHGDGREIAYGAVRSIAKAEQNAIARCVCLVRNLSGTCFDGLPEFSVGQADGVGAHNLQRGFLRIDIGRQHILRHVEGFWGRCQGHGPSVSVPSLGCKRGLGLAIRAYVQE